MILPNFHSNVLSHPRRRSRPATKTSVPALHTINNPALGSEDAKDTMTLLSTSTVSSPVCHSSATPSATTVRDRGNRSGSRAPDPIPFSTSGRESLQQWKGKRSSTEPVAHLTWLWRNTSPERFLGLYLSAAHSPASWESLVPAQSGWMSQVLKT
jgi:hypothetical protein